MADQSTIFDYRSKSGKTSIGELNLSESFDLFLYLIKVHDKIEWWQFCKMMYWEFDIPTLEMVIENLRAFSPYSKKLESFVKNCPKDIEGATMYYGLIGAPSDAIELAG